jgi:TRAP-type mannitol/chloroaromatic compound transport system permease large subunit
MIELIAQNIAPIMFVFMIAFLLLGFPVAFSLAAHGLLFFVIGVELAPFSGNAISLSWPLLAALPDRFWGIMSNETLLAVPFFTLMGLLLQRSGMAEDLLDTIGQMFGPVRGGLAFAVIFVGALLAATTGVVAASVVAMGLISLPIMLRYGYDRKISSGVIAASGTLAQIIPPSLVLIVLADQLGRSVGDMYRGALIPGLVLTTLYAAYIATAAIIRPTLMPALPQEARTLGHGVTSLVIAVLVAGTGGVIFHLAFSAEIGAHSDVWCAAVAALLLCMIAQFDRLLGLGMLSGLARQVIFVLVPPLALVFLVLGTIFVGLATPTEGGAMGATGALAMSAARGRLSFAILKDAVESTARLSAFVMFILIGARVFSLTFYGVNGHVWVEHLLTALPGGETGFLIVVNILVFLLAFFLDYFELAFIVVPLLAPVAEQLGIDLIWFGVLLAINMQTSFLHPPFGFALFFLRSVAARLPYLDRVTRREIQPVTNGQIYLGAIPFLVLQIVMIGLTIAFPAMVLHKAPGTGVQPKDVIFDLPEFGTGGNSTPFSPPALD